ncbi:MAG: phosphoglycerate dehydrogenase [Eubacteriales bacterium]|nr:phosphoglycerate dehydrogenase [Eubacteriales bacterium]
MKILITPTSFTKQQNAKAVALITAYADEVVYNPYARPLNAEEVSALLDGIDGYIAGLDDITRDVIEKAPESLRVISRYGAGVDRVDIGAAKKRGIIVTNTPGTNATAVCELTFALMLSLARVIPGLDNAVKSGKWPRSIGTELMGKTLGIVGLGAVGKRLAVRAKAFGMNVIAYDPYFDAAFAGKEGVAGLPLDAVLKKSDFISLHVPLNDETKYMIGKKQIDSMRDGAFIINTARGGLVDESEAAKAIKTGKLGGIGLDAYEVEPVTESPLMGLKNVVMTPHTGAHTNEAIEAMSAMAVKNMIDVLEGRDCSNIVV